MAPMPEDEWEEVEEQIPSMENEFVQAWIRKREDFIEKEKRLRSGMCAFFFLGGWIYGKGAEEGEGVRGGGGRNGRLEDGKMALK